MIKRIIGIICLVMLFALPVHAFDPGNPWMPVDQNLVAITGGTIDGTVVGGTTPAAGTFTSVKGDNLNYTEGILSAPTITAVDATHINVTTCDVLIRSDAVYGADEMLYRKTVAANETLTVTASVVNYIYVTWNSGTPIYAATTSRNTINNSNATPVARVVMDGTSIKYQLSYGAIGKGNPAKNFDRVMRIRGSGGIEIESGFALTESATRVINVASGYAWFGLERITSGNYKQHRSLCVLPFYHNNIAHIN